MSQPAKFIYYFVLFSRLINIVGFDSSIAAKGYIKIFAPKCTF